MGKPLAHLGCETNGGGVAFSPLLCSVSVPARAAVRVAPTKKKRPKLQQLIFDSPDSTPTRKKTKTKTKPVRRRVTKWCKEPHFSQMRKAVIAVRFHKESSTVISLQTGIPARTIRRYVEISNDPAREHDSPFYMTQDPSRGVSDKTHTAKVSPTVANNTDMKKTTFVTDDARNACNDTRNIDVDEEVVLQQLDALCTTDEMSDEMSIIYDGFDQFFGHETERTDIFSHIN